MKISLCELRKLIREEFSKKRINQPYLNSFDEDESYKEDSVYVPKDIKQKIKLWMKSMKID